MLLSPGTQDRVIGEAPTGAGTTVREGSVLTDGLLATLWVNSITAGSLLVTVSTLTDEGKEVDLFSFPLVSSGSTSLLLKQASISLQRFKVTATYTGACDYEVYVRAISGTGSGGGSGTTRLLGQDVLLSSQITVTTSPTLLIASALTDRAGLIIRNWNATTGNLFLGDSAADDLTTTAYPLAPGEALSMDVAAGVEIYGVASTGSIDVRILQAGG